MADLAGFISELKDNLSNEAFQTFKEVLGQYKKVNRQCYELCAPENLLEYMVMAEVGSKDGALYIV